LSWFVFLAAEENVAGSAVPILSRQHHLAPVSFQGWDFFGLAAFLFGLAAFLFGLAAWRPGGLAAWRPGGLACRL